MSKRVQRRRGTAAEHTSGTGFTGEIGEITVDTTANTIRIHDGITKGGHTLSRADASNLDLTNKINVNELNLAEGTDGQVLQTDGAGTLSFTDPTVGGDLSGTIKNAQIVANSVGVTELNVSAGTAGQALTITGAGALLFADVVTDPTVGGDLSGTTSNAQIVANAVGAAEIATNSVSVNELNVVEGQPDTYLKTDGNGNLSFAAVSSGGGSSTWAEDTFTGDGSTILFTLSQTADTDGKSILVYVDGVNQPLAAYTQSGTLTNSTSMTISPAPHAGAAIRVLHLGIYSEGLASGSSNFVEDLFTGDGSTTVFNYVTSTPTKESILVFIDGVAQPIGTYTLPSLTSISISPAPYVNASIRVLHLGISQGLASGSSNFVEDIMTGDGSATTFNFTTGTAAPTEESILVYIDGVNQPKSAYTLPTTTSISFSPEVPIAGAVIRVLHLGIAGAGGGGNSTTFVANGTLPNGCPVILNTDGTVSAVSSATTGQAAYETGDRTSTISVSSSGLSFSEGSAGSQLVDGLNADTHQVGSRFVFGAQTPSAGAYIRFTHTTAKVHTEAKWYGCTNANGVWKWQGSNDGTTFHNIGSSFTLQSDSGWGGTVATTFQTQTTLSANTTAYTIYQLTYVSGQLQGGDYQSEVEFKTIGAATPHFVVPGPSRPNQQRCKFALDPNNDTKFVCSYYTAADAAYQNVNICVGTIDKVNKTISFGTPFVPHTGAMEQADGLTYIKSSLAGYHGRFVFCAELSPGNFQGNCWSMLVAGAGTGTTITLESGPVQYNAGNRTTYNFVDSDPHHPGYFMVSHGTVGATRLCQFFMTPGTGALAYQSSHTLISSGTACNSFMYNPVTVGQGVGVYGGGQPMNQLYIWTVDVNGQNPTSTLNSCPHPRTVNGGHNATYDPNPSNGGKLITSTSMNIAGADGGSSWCVVSTVSGQTVTYGTEQQMTTNTLCITQFAWHPSNNGTFTAYAGPAQSALNPDGSADTDLRLVTGSLSNTTMTIDIVNDAYKYAPGSAGTDSSNSGFPPFIYDPIDPTYYLVGIYPNVPPKQSAYMYGQLGMHYSNSSQTTNNLTDQAFIGFSNSAYTNGQTATVNISGIDDNQTGLTIGSTYYVQLDGTIGTAAASPSVKAGKAVKATEIIISARG